MKKPQSKSPGPKGPVSQKFRKYEHVNDGWYITSITAELGADKIIRGNAEMMDKDNGNRERTIWWNASRDKGSWMFANAGPKLKPETPLSMNASTDTGIRRTLGKWLDKQGFVGQEKPAKAPAFQFEPLSPDANKAKPSLSELKLIPVVRIRPNADQPRREFNKSEQKRMMESMEQDGQNTPIEVVAITGDPHHDYEIVKGERRWRATKARGQTHIEAIVRPKSQIPDKNRQHRWCFIGDFHQQRYGKADIAFALMREQESGATIKELCAITGRSDAWVSNHLTLTKLIAPLRKKLSRSLPRDQQLSFNIAWRLARLPKDKQMEVYEKVMKVEGSRLQLIEVKKLISDLMPDRPIGRPRKPADNVRALLVASQRMAADALTAAAYSDATIKSLVDNKSDEARTVCDHVETIVEKLSALVRRIKKAKAA